MTKRMRELQEALPENKSIKLVSLTADPEFDTPDVLKSYAKQYSADENSWWFLTGSKSQINRLAVDGLKLVIYEKKPVRSGAPCIRKKQLFQYFGALSWPAKDRKQIPEMPSKMGLPVAS